MIPKDKIDPFKNTKIEGRVRSPYYNKKEKEEFK
jgi:hypothetical protein